MMTLEPDSRSYSAPLDSTDTWTSAFDVDFDFVVELWMNSVVWSLIPFRHFVMRFPVQFLFVESRPLLWLLAIAEKSSQVGLIGI
jgi:hypothetical protein